MSKDSLLNADYCPIPYPTPEELRMAQEAKRQAETGFYPEYIKPTLDSTRDMLLRFRQWAFGEKIREDVKEDLGDLKWKTLPKSVQKHLKAKHEILDACIEPVGLDEAVMFLEDPRWNTRAIRLDYTTKFSTKNPKDEIRQVRDTGDGYHLTFESIGGKNGYNTEYRVTASKDGKTESWRVLAVRFAKMTNEYFRSLHKLKIEEAEKRDALKKEEALLRENEMKLKKFEQEQVQISKSVATLKKGKKTKANTQKLADLEKRASEIGKSIPWIRKSVSISKAKLPELNASLEGLISRMDALAKDPKMKENASYVPYANLRKANEKGVVLPESEKEASEVERAGFMSLKQSVNHVWHGSWIRKYPASGLKDGKDGKLSLSEAFPSEIGIVLAIVERMGFVEYLSQYDPSTRKGKLKDMKTIHALMDEQIGRALNNLWLNQEGAFDYVRSDAGARGIAQMMPGTHKVFVGKYGGQKDLLNPDDFEHRYIYAATNQEQGLRFMITHLYDEARYFPQEIRENWEVLVKNPKTRFGLLGLIAAGYNGDVSRVKDEANIPSGIWSMRSIFIPQKPAKNGKSQGRRTTSAQEQLTSPSSITQVEVIRHLERILETSALQERLNGNVETQTYVMKFEYVWKYLKRRFPNEFAPTLP